MDDNSAEVNRETLYQEVWSDPVTVVAGRYGLSDVGLAKICRKLAIPLPSRGYWAKVKAGRIMGKAPLPKLNGEKVGTIHLTKPALEIAEAKQVAKKKTAAVREKVGKPPVSDDTAAFHPLVQDAATRLRKQEGWKNEKGLRSAPEEILNLQVTGSALDRALTLTDMLIKALCDTGARVRVDAKTKSTFFDIEGTAVTFLLTEHVKRSNHQETPEETKAKQRYWNRSRWETSVSFPSIPQYDFTPTGVLTISAGHWPSRNWKDTPRTLLEDRLGEIVAGFHALADQIRAREEEERRRKEEYRRAEERYAFLRARLETEQSRYKTLEQDAINWERANRLRVYADEVQRTALEHGSLTPDVSNWLEWARAKADWLDPLIKVCDLILDAPEPKKPSYW